MGKLARLTNNHSSEPVPDEELVGGVELATVIVGIAITMPAFLVGARIMAGLGFLQSLAAVMISGSILAGLSILTMKVARTSRLSTYAIVRFCFGEKGSLAINALLSLLNFGWFGFTAQLFGGVAHEMIFMTAGYDINENWFIILGGVIMVGTSIFGFRAIDLLSRISVPILFILLIVTAGLSFKAHGVETLINIPPGGTGEYLDLGTAISILIGSFIVGIIILPDMARFCRNDRECVRAAILSYGSGTPLVLISMGLPALLYGSFDIVANLKNLGLGASALIVILFATWTTTTNILYSTSLSVSQLLPRAKDWVLTLIVGVIGTIFALIGIIDYFVDFLLFLGVAIPPIAGIYIIDFFFVKNRKYHIDALSRLPPVNRLAFSSWVFSILIVKGVEEMGATVTGIIAIDSLLISAALYLAFSRYFRTYPAACK